MFGGPSDVSGNGSLFVGSMHDAKCLKLLKRYRITHIVNCAQESREYHPGHFQYLSLNLKDSPLTILEHVFDAVFNFIENARRDCGVVLIHCVSGISRAPSICLAYLLYSRQQDTLKDLMRSMRLTRAVIAPNIGFIQQLCEYEVKLRPHLDSSTLQLADVQQNTIDLNPSLIVSYDIIIDDPSNLKGIQDQIRSIKLDHTVLVFNEDIGGADHVEQRCSQRIKVTCEISQSPDDEDASSKVLHAISLLDGITTCTISGIQMK